MGECRRESRERGESKDRQQKERETVKVLACHMGLLGLVLDNVQLFESSRQEANRCQEQKSMENLLGKMAATILPFARAQYCTIFIARDRPKSKLSQLYEEDNSLKASVNSFSGLVHMEGEEHGSEFQIYKRDCTLPDIDLTHALQVLVSKETLNVSGADQDPPTGSLVCCPIRNGKTGKIIAVCQLKNKLGVAPGEPETGREFNRYEERLLEDFAVYCGLALQTVQTVQRIEYQRASQDVTQEQDPTGPVFPIQQDPTGPVFPIDSRTQLARIPYRQ
ncbi:unnamed protein product [Coregonus sp. 'balchen']|nr:unnamed protein product [Coregonus sp. 'balchen']